MTLLWKLLRRHVSAPQLAGFFAANLLGMLIVLLSAQFYRDVRPLFSRDDGVIKPEYLIVSKRVTPAGSTSAFTPGEVDELRAQPFCKGVGAFTASQYRVSCSMGIPGVASFGTEMFFESVPDRFVDTDRRRWKFDPRERAVPIILPRTYLAIYNFGFAQSQSLPKLSEGVAGMLTMDVALRAPGGREERLKGRVAGFSTRLNTILVPQSFMDWSNRELAPGADTSPTRLIVEVGNPADDAIARYIGQRGYELEDDKLDAGKTVYLLKLVTALVLGVGLLISALSFYVLMLSIYLLVQKNTEKLRSLLLIGYSPGRVSLPYQMLSAGLNAAVLALALLGVAAIRGCYMERIWAMFPQVEDTELWPVAALGAALTLGVCLLNAWAVRRRVMRIWRRKD